MNKTLFLVVIILAFLFDSQPAKSQDLQVLLDSSTYHWDTGNFEKAFGLLATGVETANKMYESGDENGAFNYAYFLNQMGVRLYQAEVLDKAESYYAASLPLFEESEGTDGTNYLTAVENLALCYNDQGKFPEALELYTLLLSNTSYQQALGESIYQTYNTAGICAYQAGNHDQARGFYDSALALLTTEHQDYWIIVENLLLLEQTWGMGIQAEEYLAPFLEKFPDREADFTNLIAYLNQDYGLAAFEEGDYQESIPYFEKTLKYLVVNDETDRLTQIYRRQDLCAAYSQTRQFAKGLSLLLENVPIVKEHYGEGSLDHVIAINNVAIAYAELADYKQSGKWYKLGFRLIERGEENSSELLEIHGLMLTNYTDLLTKQGHYEEAKKYCQKTIELYSKDETTYFDDLTFTLNQSALILATIGEYEKAEGLLLKLLARQQEKNGLENELATTIASNLTTIYVQTGRYDRAIEFVQFLLVNDRAIHGEASYEYAFSLQTAGITLYSVQDYEGAIEYLEKSYKIRREMVGDENQDVLKLRQSIASAYTKAGRLDEAEKVLSEVLTMQKKSLGDKHVDLSFTYGDLGMAAYARGKFDEAIKNFEEALSLEKRVLGDYNQSTVTSIFNIACAYEAQGKSDKSAGYFDLAIQNYLHIVDEFFPFLGEKERLEYYHTIKGQLSAYYSFLNSQLDANPEFAAKMYNTHIRTKGMLLNESMELRSFLNSQSDPAIKKIYDQWININQEVAKLEQLSLDATQQVYVDSLKISGEEFERILNANTKKETTTTTWQDVAQSLKDGEVAIEIIRVTSFDFQENKHLNNEKNYIALIIDNQTSMYPQFVRLSNGQAMDANLFNGYKNKIKFKLADKDSYGHYWQPIAEGLKGYETIYLSQDGAYQLLNLNTLLNPETGKYVIDESTIQIIGNTKELLDRESPTSAKSATLFGFPNFSTRPNKNNTDKERSGVFKEIFSQGVSDLPGTKIEVENIDQLMESKGISTTTFLADEAHETQFKSTTSTDILHIATHGFFEESSGNFIKDDPLLHSGLLLADLKETITPDEENGIITAKEIAQMNLQETELVVLSACETGKGEVVDGQGVYGLQRAFQVAGADNVIISLWKVDDEATKELMTLFYQNYLQNNDARKALKSAQLKLKEKFPEPIYWGAFYVVGN